MKRSRSILICLAGTLALAAAARAGNPSAPQAPGPGGLPPYDLRQKTVMMNKMMLLKKLHARNPSVNVPSSGAVTPMAPPAAPAQPNHAPAKSVPADNGQSGNPYGSIVTRNVFALNPPPPPSEPPPSEPPPKITLTGITTIFGPKEALFKVAGVPRPGVPPKDESYILTEGESQDDVQVRNIDVDKGIVTFINHEVVQDIPLAAGVASGGAAPGGGNGGGFQPPRFGGPGGGPPGFNNNFQNFRQRFQQQRYGGATPSGATPYSGFNGYTPPNQAGMSQLSGDDQQALIAAERAAASQPGSTIPPFLYPPTKYDKQVSDELNGGGGGSGGGNGPPPVP